MALPRRSAAAVMARLRRPTAVAITGLVTFDGLRAALCRARPAGAPVLTES